MPNLDFDMPQNQSSAIKVIGIGGGGSNAVNYMYHKGIKGVDFVVCNTDQQALDDSPVPTKIQLGVSLTEGLGAGAWPVRGRMAAEENINDVIEVLECNTKMVFLNAGMGGGTGTGAAPVIAKAAKDLDILTVAIVTIPFVFEGELRMSQAKEGIEEIKKYVDSLIIINNNKLIEIYGNLGFKSGFAKADEILATASRGIAEVITQKGHLNIDLNDAKTVLSNSGTAIMGSGTALGDGRAIKAVKGAIESPLLDNNHIRGAKKVLLLIVSGSEEVTFEEMDEISSFIQDQVMTEGGSPADIIMGVAEDEDLESSINVTVVATGFYEGAVVNPLTGIPEKVVHDLEAKTQTITKEDKETNNSSTEADLNVQESSVKVKHNLIDSDHLDLSSSDIPVNGHPEEVDQFSETLDLFKSSDQKQQVSMTFDLNVSEIDSSSEENFSEDSKVVFNLEEDTVAEELSLNEMSNKVVRSVEEDDNVINDSFVPNEADDSIIEEDISFEIDTDNQKNKEKVSPDFTESYTEENDESHQKIIHTLSVEDEELPDANSSIMEHVTEDSRLISEINEQKSNQFDSNSSSILDEAPNEGVKSSVDYEENSIAQSTTNSKAVQEQINRAQKRKERLQKFNYRFRNNTGVELAENEPAYKRQGVELNDIQHSSEETVSNLNLSQNQDGELELKSKNSFLHDNVD
ncbi:MAG: cell division protein FtsZ [Cryomorphaceae bacterium]|nr:MAG: cell division protein FtsZ [Cryomorphaceae bacterium]